MVVRTLLGGMLYAVVAGFGGLLLFAVSVWFGWLDGPGGGMVVFPLVLVPAIGFGLYGLGRIGRRLATETEQSSEQSISR